MSIAGGFSAHWAITNCFGCNPSNFGAIQCFLFCSKVVATVQWITSFTPNWQDIELNRLDMHWLISDGQQNKFLAQLIYNEAETLAAQSWLCDKSPVSYSLLRLRLFMWLMMTLKLTTMWSNRLADTVFFSITITRSSGLANSAVEQ